MSTPTDETSLAETGQVSGSSDRPTSASRSGWLSTSGSDGEGAIPLGSILSDRYRVIGLLGRGGMGEVYRADDLRLGQQVALKFLPDGVRDDSQRLAQFHNEVRIARQVSHRNVCRVYDIGEAEGRIFLTMEYVDGEDLASLLKRIGRFPQEKGTEIARQICAGLGAAHDLGVLHRDLKPANIMLDGEGRVRITDFGLAGVAGEIKDLRSGTPAYMSPEQLAGREVSVRSDIFSLGLVLFEIFTGRRAFEAKTVAELLRMHDEGVALSASTTVRDLDPAIERAIERCLNPDPVVRPPSAIAVSAALPGGDPLAAALAAGETPSPEMVAAAGRTDAVPVRQSLPLLLSFLLGLVALVAVIARTGVTAAVPLELPPAVLEDRARTAIARLGHPTTAEDTAGGFIQTGDYVAWVRRTRTGRDRWAALATGRTPAVAYWYRTSPRSLAPLQAAPRPTSSDPPLTITGMNLVALDTMGRVLEFHHVPVQKEAAPPDPAAPVQAPDWQAVFDLAGLPRDRFTPATPEWTPRGIADARAAWTGTLPELGDAPLRVEAAAFRGRVTYIQTLGPWARPVRMESAPVDATQRALGVVTGVVLLTALVGAMVMARRNLVLGRGDRRSATRVALFIVGTLMASWIVGAHHTWDFANERERLFQQCADALFPAATFWVVYLAIEPWVRRHWPSSLVSWTRLLTRGVRDPLVGRDVLIGLLFGVALPLYLGVGRLVPEWLGEDPSAPPLFAVQMLGRAGLLLDGLLVRLTGGLMNGVLVALLYVGLRRLLRTRWLAAVALTIVFTLFVGAEGAFSGSLLSSGMAVVFAVLMLVPLLRFGLLPFVVSTYTHQVLQATPLTFAFDRWYSTPTIVVCTGLLAVAVYAYVQSRAGQPLIPAAVDA